MTTWTILTATRGGARGFSDDATTRFQIGCPDQAQIVKARLAAARYTVGEYRTETPPTRSDEERARAQRIMTELFAH